MFTVSEEELDKLLVDLELLTEELSYSLDEDRTWRKFRLSLNSLLRPFRHKIYSVKLLREYCGFYVGKNIPDEATLVGSIGVSLWDHNLIVRFDRHV